MASVPILDLMAAKTQTPNHSVSTLEQSRRLLAHPLSRLVSKTHRLFVRSKQKYKNPYHQSLTKVKSLSTLSHRKLAPHYFNTKLMQI